MKKHGTSAPLPLNDTLSPGIPLDQIGQTLASFYDDLVSEGMPEHLAALVRRVRQTEDDRVAAAGPVAVAAETDPRRVALVVEDDPAIRALAETLLEETELDVVGCDSAEAALSVLQARGGDVALVFADVRLAGHMDGLQLARAVATLWPRARLVITSGTACAAGDAARGRVHRQALAPPGRAGRSRARHFRSGPSGRLRAGGLPRVRSSSLSNHPAEPGRVTRA